MTNNYPDAKVFEPTVCVFDNGVLLQYKKVGTRFFRTLVCNGQDNIHTDNKQIDFTIKTYPSNIINGNDSIEYKFSKKYVHTPWHEKEKLRPEDLNEKLRSYPRWNTDNDFLTEMGVKSYTEFFFENKKDIIFLVRNPLDRFFSGVTQCIIAYCFDVQHWPDEYDFFKSQLQVSDEMMGLIIKCFVEAQFDSISVTEHLPPNIIKKVFKYFISNKWGMIIRDVHSEPYLVHFQEIMYNIKDTSKIKIIDLSHLRTPAAAEFFSKLRNVDDRLYEEIMKDQRKEDNSPIYKYAIDLYRNNHFFTNDALVNDSASTCIVSEYLKQEIIVYHELINSSHFVNLGV